MDSSCWATVLPWSIASFWFLVVCASRSPFMMSVMCHQPMPWFGPLSLRSDRSTCVLSNLPGPLSLLSPSGHSTSFALMNEAAYLYGRPLHAAAPVDSFPLPPPGDDDVLLHGIYCNCGSSNGCIWLNRLFFFTLTRFRLGYKHLCNCSKLFIF